MNNWRLALKSNHFKAAFFIGILGIILVGIIAPIMVSKAQMLNANRIHDPILSLFNPIDVSSLIAFFINGGVIAAFFYLLNKPYYFISAVNCYWITTLLRMFTINFFPMDAPEKIIVLTDPFLNEFVYRGAVITKDLFFSGHVSSMFIIFLNAPKGLVKILFLINTLLIATLILLQHVHYTIDVIAAFPISYVIYRLVQLFPYQQKTVDN